jgi:hypothetical protein
MRQKKRKKCKIMANFLGVLDSYTAPVFQIFKKISRLKIATTFGILTFFLCRASAKTET